MRRIFHSSSNTINGLFHIPDENSFIKKLILSHETTYNDMIVQAFRVLQTQHSNIELIHKEYYFALLLPTISEGVQLEAMLITTKTSEGELLLSIYHRLHFDTNMYPIELIEADAFLSMASVVVNAPLSKARGVNGIDGILSLLNFQISEAQNIEISMLTLADANSDTVHEYGQIFLMNSIARYMLAARLDDIEYILAMSENDIAALIARYADIAFEDAMTGITKLHNFREDIRSCEAMFIAEFASATSCLTFLYLEPRTTEALLDDGGFNVVKTLFLEKSMLYGLQKINALGETLGSFEQLD